MPFSLKIQNLNIAWHLKAYVISGASLHWSEANSKLGKIVNCHVTLSVRGSHGWKMTNSQIICSDIWSSVTEQNLFLDNGLQFIIEVLQPPLISKEHAAFVDFFEYKFDSNAEICRCLLNSCALQHGSYFKFFRYRQQALLGLWHLKKNTFTKAVSKHSRPPVAQKLFSTGDKPKAQTQGLSFSSHVSLLLLLPILRSQSQKDSSLAGHCSEVLLQCLQNCPPNSLSTEPVSCMKGLADLLFSWLLQTESGVEESSEAVCEIKRENLVAALISLACGRY